MRAPGGGRHFKSLAAFSAAATFARARVTSARPSAAARLAATARSRASAAALARSAAVVASSRARDSAWARSARAVSRRTWASARRRSASRSSGDGRGARRPPAARPRCGGGPNHLQGRPRVPEHVEPRDDLFPAELRRAELVSKPGIGGGGHERPGQPAPGGGRRSAPGFREVPEAPLDQGRDRVLIGLVDAATSAVPRPSCACLSWSAAATSRSTAARSRCAAWLIAQTTGVGRGSLARAVASEAFPARRSSATRRFRAAVNCSGGTRKSAVTVRASVTGVHFRSGPARGRQDPAQRNHGITASARASTVGGIG